MDYSSTVPPPKQLRVLIKRLETAAGIPPNARFTQAIVSWYPRKGGLSPHVDRLALFGPVIASVGLQGRTSMRLAGDGRQVTVRMGQGDAIVLRDDARTRWTHEVLQSDAERLTVSLRSVLPDTRHCTLGAMRQSPQTPVRGCRPNADERRLLVRPRDGRL